MKSNSRCFKIAKYAQLRKLVELAYISNQLNINLKIP